MSFDNFPFPLCFLLDCTFPLHTSEQTFDLGAQTFYTKKLLCHKAYYPAVRQNENFLLMFNDGIQKLCLFVNYGFATHYSFANIHPPLSPLAQQLVGMRSS